MAEISGPWDATAIGDATRAPYSTDEWAQHWRGIQGVGSVRNDNGIILGSGAESAQLDGLQVTQNSPAGASVLLNIGVALVRGRWYYNDTALALSIAANASGNPRVDTIVLRCSWAAKTIRAAVLQGTPAASPVPPTLTQSDGVTWEIPIADIAVANGFVSITNSNITSRAISGDMAEGVYLDRIKNNSGAVNQTGDAVILDTTADRAATTTTLANHNLPLGAWVGRSAAAAQGRVLNIGIGYLRTNTSVARGNYGAMSTTARQVLPSTKRLANTFARFMEATAGAGLALAQIDAGLMPNFGRLIASVNFSGASIVADLLPQWYDTHIIEFAFRSAVVAATDTVNIRLGSQGGGGLDATAGNYYSYAGFFANSAPVVTAVQNLGASANWQVTCPGATAPANYQSYGIMEIRPANSSSAYKWMSGRYYAQVGNVNGNLYVANIGGVWLSTTKALEQLSITLASATNFASGRLEIYGRD